MTIETSIRAASASVTEECAALDALFRSGMIDRRGGEAWLAEHQPLSELGEWWSDSFVACIDDAVVGLLVGRMAVDDRGRLFVVDRVFVHEQARGLGCGDELLDAAIAHAIARGCDYIEGSALPGDRDTKNLYERAGVTARSITVSQRLSDRSSSGDASR